MPDHLEAAAPASGRAVCLVAPPGPEKLALISRLAGWLRGRGRRLAVLSLSSSLPLPDEQKDTGRFRRAGARMVALAAPGWLQLNFLNPGDPAFPSLAQSLDLLSSFADLILVDGQTRELPQVIMALSPPVQEPGQGAAVLAYLGQAPPAWQGPVFAPGEAAALGRFLLKRLGVD